MTKSPEKKSFFAKFKRDQGIGARRTVIEELFNDMYKDRRNIYLMNFIRGIFFGLGSVIGGTVIVGLIVWTLTLFGHIPGLGETTQNFKDSIRADQSGSN